MEIRQNVQRVPTRPFVLAIAFLSVLALALTTWYTMARSPQTVSPGPARSYAAPLYNSGPMGPDAQARDLQQRIAQIKEDGTHGH